MSNAKELKSKLIELLRNEKTATLSFEGCNFSGADIAVCYKSGKLKSFRIIIAENNIKNS